MAKFGTGERYATGLLYGADPQYLSAAGNISGLEGFGTVMVSPGPVIISGAGNIPSLEILGTPGMFLIPKKLALGVSFRRLSAAPQIRRLQVNPNG